MAENPLLVHRVQGWIAKARSFHQAQRAKTRRVWRVGRSRLTYTTGQAVTTVGGVFVASSSQTAGMPSWTFWVLLLGGFAGGRYVFPVPDSSIASNRGPSALAAVGSLELDHMTPSEIRAYANNMLFQYELKDTRDLGTEQALERQIGATRAAEAAAKVPAGQLSGVSTADAQVFGAAAAKHNELQRRWLTYELDPKLQFDFPDMSDVSVPATADMIRAQRKAEQAKAGTDSAAYWSAVAEFGWALAVAEGAAGVTQK